MGYSEGRYETVIYKWNVGKGRNREYNNRQRWRPLNDNTLEAQSSERLNSLRAIAIMNKWRVGPGSYHFPELAFYYPGPPNC